MTQADEFIKEKAKEGIKITYTHIALKCVGMSYHNIKDTLCKIVFGRVVPIEDVDIFTLVDIDDGKDLAGITVRKCDKLGIAELAQQIQGKVAKIKSKKDGNHKQQTGAAE